MKLPDYLASNSLTEADFAEQIGVTREAVRRYCAAERIPDKRVMIRIADRTGNAVTANDFFGISSISEEAAA